MKEWFFDSNVKVTMLAVAALDCSHQGKCDDEIAYWVAQDDVKIEGSDEDIIKVLDEYGAWSAEDLADHTQNKHRLLWIAACNIKEEMT